MANFIKDRLKSIGHAVDGLIYFIKNEYNAKIHVIAAVLVTILGFYYKISSFEWIGLVISIGVVIMSEIINSSIEELADKVEPEHDKMIKTTKDLASGAVLFAAIMAIIIGGIIFIPKMIG